MLLKWREKLEIQNSNNKYDDTVNRIIRSKCDEKVKTKIQTINLFKLKIDYESSSACLLY
ncbi:hypothetical protein BD31_I1570 [Candidatus Nitrosopumilus salaria BD31]|uniref:Uncharacterized protein n=1 Tax=Candidatus Nitrosopumilus salarius BD31 TaxID=859350 RepID=I3D1K3_9ARCH|nr:hypothetical protein BD31_I1570 [Candidatus Nitrosopumilus salaria BD31]